MQTQAPTSLDMKVDFAILLAFSISSTMCAIGWTALSIYRGGWVRDLRFY